MTYISVRDGAKSPPYFVTDDNLLIIIIWLKGLIKLYATLCCQDRTSRPVKRYREQYNCSVYDLIAVWCATRRFRTRDDVYSDSSIASWEPHPSMIFSEWVYTIVLPRPDTLYSLTYTRSGKLLMSIAIHISHKLAIESVWSWEDHNVEWRLPLTSQDNIST